MKVTVIGLGQFGCQLALTLAEDDHEVVVVDHDEKTIDSLKDRVAHAVIADATDIKVLEQLGFTDADRVCVTVGEDFASSLLITGHLQELGVRHIFCRSINPVHERLLRLMNVEQIIHAESLAARQFAKRMGIRGATRHFALSEDYCIVDMRAPSFLVGKKLVDADLRRRFAVNLITVRRGSGTEQKVLGIPPPDLVFESQDELVVFGREAAVKAFSSQRGS